MAGTFSHSAPIAAEPKLSAIWGMTKVNPMCSAGAIAGSSHRLC